MKVKIVKELPTSKSGASQVLVRCGSDYFVVSSVHVMFTGFETLVFPSDAEGNVTAWGEVAGGRGMAREEAIAELERTPSNSREQGQDILPEWQDPGDDNVTFIAVEDETDRGVLVRARNGMRIQPTMLIGTACIQRCLDCGETGRCAPSCHQVTDSDRA